MIEIGSKVRENWSPIVGEVIDIIGNRALIKWPSGRRMWQRIDLLVDMSPHVT